jgi:3-oxoacyl-[acyl-carrier-protein] synthase II
MNKPGINRPVKRVVVTGIGAVSPIGNSFFRSWVNARSGLSGIQPTTRFDVSGSKWKVAGELKKFDAGQFLSLREITRLDPFVHYAVSAALMAVEDAHITNHPSLAAAGVIIGSSRGGISTLEKELQKKYSSRPASCSSHTSAYLMPSTTISMASSYVAQKLGIRGYCLGISNACASGTNAIGEAYRLIGTGYEDLVLCGGAEAPLCSICSEGYGISGALSARNDSTASRPFDRTRDGFVLSEGACIMVLEDYESALKRSSNIYGEVIGYGNTTDAFHQIKPSPEGEAEAIRAAMDETGLKASDIRFINAHGTSTPLGDKTETEAIKLFFGRYAYKIPVTSVKSMTGHMLAASGPFEAALTLMSMKEGILPPTINLKERDPECDLDYVTEARKTEIEFAISQSFGFGGVNAVLVFKRLGA